MFDPSDKEENVGDTRTLSRKPSTWHSQTWAAHMLFEMNCKAVARQVDLEVWAYHLPRAYVFIFFWQHGDHDICRGDIYRLSS